MKKPELLAPGGSLEKLKIAIKYGADAVYIGGEAYSLRAAAENFSIEDMKRGLEFAHKQDKKVYLTANIIPHNKDIEYILARRRIIQTTSRPKAGMIWGQKGLFLRVK